MIRAIWNDVVIAESETYIEKEGDIYFPPESIRQEFFSESNTKAVCPAIGTARYLNLTVNGDQNRDAAWRYPKPKPEAVEIKDHIAFWKGVIIER